MSKKTKSIGLMDIKRALSDGRFRSKLPQDLQSEVAKYIQNPGCPGCGVPLFRKILKSCRKELSEFFPGQEVMDEEKEIQKLAENHWSVINCGIHELEDKLRSLSPGRKQIAITRFENEVTVIVNEIDVLY